MSQDADRPDDPTIGPNAGLWRRIPPLHVVYDANTGRLRISSSAFSDDRDGDPMSVVLEDVAVEGGRGADSILTGHPAFGVARFTAGTARKLGQRVVRSPQPDEPAHGSVIGKKTTGVKRQLSATATWCIRNPTDAVIAGLPADVVAVLKYKDIHSLMEDPKNAPPE